MIGRGPTAGKPEILRRQAATSRNAAPPRPRNALVSSVEVAQFIVVAVSINLQRSFHTFQHVRSVVCSPPSVQPSSRRAARSTTITSSPKETAGPDGIVSPDRHASEMGENSSPLSSSPSCSAPPGHANEPATALQHARPTRVGSYLRDTPGLRHFKHPADQTRHRIPLRPPQPFPG